MNRAMRINEVPPVIDQEYAYTAVSQAFGRLSRGPLGKVVVRVGILL